MKLFGHLSRVGIAHAPHQSHHSAAAHRCGGFAAVGPEGRRYRSIAAWPALSSICEQSHCQLM